MLASAAVAILLIAGARTTFAQTETAGGDETAQSDAASVSHGAVYRVGAFAIEYLRENPLHPPIADAAAMEILLGKIDSGYVAPSEGIILETITLAGSSDDQVEAYHADALQHILEAVRDHYVQQDLMGIYIAPDPRQINEFGEDLRDDLDTALTIVVTTGIVTEMRTLGSGERVAEEGEITPEDRIDNPLHARVVEQSPIHPYQEGEEERRDLLYKGELDRHLFHLGRHPGRRVDATIAAAEEIGGIALDYMVTENRPLVIYAQVSNTGTASTDYWRERFGLFHTQVTNNDDIFGLDYSTAKFDQVHAVVGTYEAPFPNDRIRWRIEGAWSEYTAADIGAFRDTFTGKSWSLAAEIIANIYQERELFIDVVGGARYERQRADNVTFRIVGDEEFVIPYAGLRLDRTAEWFSTQATMMFEFQSDSINDTEVADLTRLGRALPDEDWTVMRWNATHSVYLEPLLDREAWEDPSTPESSTLAHEVLFGFRGQYAFGHRLIPQAEHVIGGLYSVRGYPQSIVAGDSAVIGSVEYRYHVPRDFKIQPEPREMFGEPFRASPQYVYGHPDWDLILKGFFDIGHSMVSNELSFESDETLIGAGIGVEFLYKRNLNVRLDWGFVLDDLDGSNVHSGSNRLHLVATVLF